MDILKSNEVNMENSDKTIVKLIEEMRKKSLLKEDGKLKTRITSIKKSTYYRYLSKIVGICALSATLYASGALASHNLEKIQDDISIYHLSEKFYETIINPEISITSNKEGYYYDYLSLADKIEKFTDIDEAVYFLNFYLGDTQTDKVLEYTEYKNFSHFLKLQNYESKKEFQNNTVNKIIAHDTIADKEEELYRIQNEVDENIDKSKGGKR